MISESGLAPDPRSRRVSETFHSVTGDCAAFPIPRGTRVDLRHFMSPPPTPPSGWYGNWNGMEQIPLSPSPERGIRSRMRKL